MDLFILYSPFFNILHVFEGFCCTYCYSFDPIKPEVAMLLLLAGTGGMMPVSTGMGSLEPGGDFLETNAGLVGVMLQGTGSGKSKQYIFLGCMTM